MGRPLVLCYHALSPAWDAPLSTPPTRFAAQIRLLLARGYRAVTFSELVRDRHRNTFAITFDDAYESVARLARPLLASLGAPATLYVPTDYVGTDEPMSWPGIDQWHGGQFESELRPMSWSQVQSLIADGWEIGSHSGSHPHLTQLPDADLRDELARSKSECEQHTDRPCVSIAYPYGDCDDRVAVAAERAGYGTGATLPSRLHSPNPLLYPRIGVYHADTRVRYRLKVSPALRVLRASRLWSVLAHFRTQ